MSLTEHLNRLFDRCVRREVRCCAMPAFQVCGLLGGAAALAVAMALAQQRGLSVVVVLGLAALSLITFLALAIVTKILAGAEVLIYYHHEIAVFATTAMCLRVAGAPVLSYLDLTAAGLGTFLAFGRVGCLNAACCHGKPSAWGVRYESKYMADGLAREFAGKRLFPLQLLESGLAAALTLLLILCAAKPGQIFAGYVIGYAFLRFVLEFFRGDTDRRYWRTFSEAQWTSCLLITVMLAHPAALLLPALLLGAGEIRTRRRLLHAAHLRELAEAEQQSPRVICSSLGVRLSFGRIPAAHGAILHYSISGEPLPERHARALCCTLAGRLGRQEWIRGGHGVFHLLVRSEEPSCKI